MDAAELTALARAVAAGDMTPEQLVERARLDTVTDLGYAQIDTERGRQPSRLRESSTRCARRASNAC